MEALPSSRPEGRVTIRRLLIVTAVAGLEFGLSRAVARRVGSEDVGLVLFVVAGYNVLLYCLWGVIAAIVRPAPGVGRLPSSAIALSVVVIAACAGFPLAWLAAAFWGLS